jgi:hypothetical protein
MQRARRRDKTIFRRIFFASESRYMDMLLIPFRPERHDCGAARDILHHGHA